MNDTNSTQVTVLAASRRTPAMRGAAKKWSYTSCGVYEAKKRSRREGYYWEGPISSGPDRRGRKIAEKDLEELAERYDCEVIDWDRSIRRTDATDYVCGVAARAIDLFLDQCMQWSKA